jgi:hypothetical protein
LWGKFLISYQRWRFIAHVTCLHTVNVQDMRNCKMWLLQIILFDVVFNVGRKLFVCILPYPSYFILPTKHFYVILWILNTLLFCVQLKNQRLKTILNLLKPHIQLFSLTCYFSGNQGR